MIRSRMWRPRSKIKRESHRNSNVSFSLESNWKMDVLCPIITFRRNLPFIWCSDYVVVRCRSSSKRWPEKPSPSMWSQMIPFRMWRLRFRTKREFLQSNSDWSLLVNNWRMDELSRITISKRNRPCTWCCDWEEVPCKFSSRPWPERRSPSMWSLMTPSKMSRRRSRTRKVSHQSNNVSFSRESNWRMDGLSQITTSRRNPLCTWCWDCEVARCKFLSRLWLERPLRWT